MNRVGGRSQWDTMLWPTSPGTFTFACRWTMTPAQARRMADVTAATQWPVGSGLVRTNTPVLVLPQVYIRDPTPPYFYRSAVRCPAPCTIEGLEHVEV